MAKNAIINDPSKRKERLFREFMACDVSDEIGKKESTTLKTLEEFFSSVLDLGYDPIPSDDMLEKRNNIVRRYAEVQASLITGMKSGMKFNFMVSMVSNLLEDFFRTMDGIEYSKPVRFQADSVTRMRNSNTVRYAKMISGLK